MQHLEFIHTRFDHDVHDILPHYHNVWHLFHQRLLSFASLFRLQIIASRPECRVRLDISNPSLSCRPNIDIMSSNSIPSAGEIESLGHKIKDFAVELQRARNNNNEDLDTENQLLDALDDLRAEIIEPAKWPGTFFAPPEFAAMQVAFQRDIFQKVPLAAGASIHTRDLAALAKIDEDILLRIMRCLAANKIFVETDEKVFAHTPISAAQAEEYVAARTGGILNDFYKASTSLAEAIGTGKGTAWEARFGMPMHEYFEKTPTPDRARMAKAMVLTSTLEREELATLVPWQDFRKVVDVGGGAGHLAATLTQVSHSKLETP